MRQMGTGVRVPECSGTETSTACMSCTGDPESGAQGMLKLQLSQKKPSAGKAKEGKRVPDWGRGLC